MSRDNQRIPPLEQQRGMEGIPSKRYGWRDILIQALALIEDEIGIPYDQSALYKRRDKARTTQQIRR
jgi:hypothetical protein